jgi:hypothetical protein
MKKSFLISLKFQGILCTVAGALLTMSLVSYWYHHFQSNQSVSPGLFVSLSDNQFKFTSLSYSSPFNVHRNIDPILSSSSFKSSFSSSVSAASLLFYNFSELTLWSSDFHISPIADIKYFLSTHFNVSIIDKSLSSHCHFTETCATSSAFPPEKGRKEGKNPLDILTRQNGISLEPCPNQIKNDFYETYRKKDWFEEKVDGFLCLHAIGLCEVYMSFGKPLIAIASTRFSVPFFYAFFDLPSLAFFLLSSYRLSLDMK